MVSAIHWHESAMDLYVFPILIPPPSPSHPSGSSQCTNPEHLSHASNLGWQSVSHLIIYMFQCYSLRGEFFFFFFTFLNQDRSPTSEGKESYLLLVLTLRSGAPFPFLPAGALLLTPHNGAPGLRWALSGTGSAGPARPQLLLWCSAPSSLPPPASSAVAAPLCPGCSSTDQIVSGSCVFQVPSDS